MDTPARTKKQLVVGQRWLDKSEARAERILALLEELRVAPRYLERVLLNNSIEGHFFFLKTNEIDWVEAEGNYVRLHCGPKSHLLRRTISQLETNLDPGTFLRIHRSTIVNINLVKKLEPLSHGELRVLLEDGTKLTWSRGYKNKLKEF